MLRRRHLLAAGLAWPAATWATETNAEALLRTGGVVVALRHAQAPGTYDPPQFRLGDCSTQRNLSDAGRAQARRLGEWFRARALPPAQVRSSPWCRCVDTATLAFDRADAWAALGSPEGVEPATRNARLQDLQQALRAASAQRGRLEVWVTHNFVLADLTGASADSGEGFILQAAADGSPRILGRLPAV